MSLSDWQWKFQDEDIKKALEDSSCLQRTYEKYIDKVIVNEDMDQTFLQIVEVLDTLANQHQWVPVNWVYWRDVGHILTFVFFIPITHHNASNIIHTFKFDITNYFFYVFILNLVLQSKCDWK